jgi:hypothetical protein
VIARLRARHRAIFLALAGGLPALAIGALALRPGPAWSAAAPLARVAPPGIRILLNETRAELAEQSQLGIHVLLDPDWNEPGVVLYWSPSEPSGRRLPSNARPIGPVGHDPASGYPWSERSGWFSLYSVARQEFLAAGAYVEPDAHGVASIRLEP